MPPKRYSTSLPTIEYQGVEKTVVDGKEDQGIASSPQIRKRFDRIVTYFFRSSPAISYSSTI